LSSEDACLGGCRKGSAKFLKSNAQGGCQDWCSSAHPNDKTLADACLVGCNAYTPKEENVSSSDNNSTTQYGWLDHFKHLADITRGFFRRVMRRMGMPCDGDCQPVYSAGLKSTTLPSADEDPLKTAVPTGQQP
uniref:WSC domain-containing protein n=1 Tax=Echinostoma caproni TaxID=27848 RepID=A0A183AXE5_9TREM